MLTSIAPSLWPSAGDGVLAGALIAVDWGTTRRRCYLLSPEGAVLDAKRDDRGVQSLDRGDYAAEFAALRDRFGVTGIVCAGMVGSTLGAQAVPYVDAPADLAALAAGAMEIESGVLVVPGVALRQGGRADVMRGEEVMALGAVAAGLVPETALLATPGTHNKWISLAAGMLADFRTTITGEMFALLRRQGTLAEMLRGPVSDGIAFRSGVERARAGDLLAALFEIRAGVLTGALGAADAPSRASGLLIGADIAASPGVVDRDVHVLAAEPLGALYASAIRHSGGRPIAVDAQVAFVAGAHAIWQERGR